MQALAELDALLDWTSFSFCRHPRGSASQLTSFNFLLERCNRLFPTMVEYGQ